MAPRQSRKHSGEITVGLADLGRTFPHLCPTPLPSQSLASRMASARSTLPAATLQGEKPEKQTASKFVPREDVRILPPSPRGRGQDSMDSPGLAPHMSGETLVELWDAPIEETLPDSKLAKEIIASRTSPVFSPKMGQVRILARPHSSTESTTQSPPMSASEARSPIAGLSAEEVQSTAANDNSHAVDHDPAEVVSTTHVSYGGSKVTAVRRLPVTRLTSDRDRPPEEQKISEVENTKESISTKSRRSRKGKGRGGSGQQRYKQWNNNSYYYYY